MPADTYLVAFVVDPAQDAHAEELGRLADAARQLHLWGEGEPRAFDVVPGETEERTVGVALRVSGLPEADRHAVVSLVHGLAAAGARLGIRLEVQLDEVRLGELSGGEADPGVVDGLRDGLGLDLR